MYWTDSGLNEIFRSNLDGSSIQTVLSVNATGSMGLALDLVGQKMYWTNDTDVIRRANLDGSGVETLVSQADHILRGIALDLVDGEMLWAVQGLNLVREANLDGSNEQTIISSGLAGPEGIAIAASVPEPSSLTLLVIAAVVGLTVVRRAGCCAAQFTGTESAYVGG